MTRCADCRRELEPGDLYIEDTASGYCDAAADSEIDSIVADIFNGNDRLDGASGGKIIYCEDCTVPGGKYKFETYYGDGE